MSGHDPLSSQTDNQRPLQPTTDRSRDFKCGRDVRFSFGTAGFVCREPAPLDYRSISSIRNLVTIPEDLVVDQLQRLEAGSTSVDPCVEPWCATVRFSWRILVKIKPSSCACHGLSVIQFISCSNRSSDRRATCNYSKERKPSAVTAYKSSADQLFRKQHPQRRIRAGP